MTDVSSLATNDALIVVDVQKDFLPGGALPVPEGDEVVSPLNRCIGRFVSNGLTVVATRDWHPADHCSFTDQGGIWPAHCVAGTDGAAFANDLNLPEDVIVVSKATHADRDAYSAFVETGLAATLEERGVTRVFVGGLATDYCVLNTVRDALTAGFEVVFLLDAVRAVDVEPGDGHNAIEEHDPARRRAGIGGGARSMNNGSLAGPNRLQTTPLLTDLYQLTMLHGYHCAGMDETAVFEFFVRKLPAQRGFLLAAGQQQVVEFLQGLRFEESDLAWARDSDRFDDAFIEHLAQLRFTGDVDAMPEGTVFFANEPVLRVVAPMAEAQLIESRVINLLHLQTMIATKAARCRLAAPDRLLVDFGMRRAHGAEAALLSARAAYVAGFDGTATVLAGQRFGIPLYGTMAHSFVQCHDTQIDAFRAFAHAQPDNVVLLIDTYDTSRGAQCVVELVPELAAEGITVRAVRIDSGNLVDEARRVRSILDAGNCSHVNIFASGSLDEFELARCVGAGAPIDGYGVGTNLDTSADAPYLDCVYKLQEYAGRARRKRSEGKATWPGRKQVYRQFAPDGTMLGDVLTIDGDVHPGEPLLRPLIRNGQPVDSTPSLADIRDAVRARLQTLPPALQRLEAMQYPVEIALALKTLANEVDRVTT